MKPEKSRRKGRPPWKVHPNHHTPKQGSKRDDLTKEQKKRAPHDCQRMTRKSGQSDIRQPKTQNETPQQIPKMGTSRGRRVEARAHPRQDRAAKPEQGRRQEES